MEKVVVRRAFLLTTGVLLKAGCAADGPTLRERVLRVLGPERQQPARVQRPSWSEGQTVSLSGESTVGNFPIGFCGVVEQVAEAEIKVKITDVWGGEGSLLGGFLLEGRECVTRRVLINRSRIGQTIWIQRTCDELGPGCSAPYRPPDPFRK